MIAATFDNLFTQHVMSSLDKQLRLADLLDNKGTWSTDLRKGTISFKDVGTYKMQVLGTESEGDDSWLWGWANEASNIPTALLNVADNLRDYGNKHSIEELTQAEQSLDDIDGHQFGLIASGFAQAQAYHRCPYNGGALFALIMDPTLKLTVENDLVRATTVINQAVSTYDMHNQNIAIDAYLTYLGLDVYSSNDTKYAQRDDETVMTITFDKNNRMTKLESTI